MIRSDPCARFADRALGKRVHSALTMRTRLATLRGIAAEEAQEARKAAMAQHPSALGPNKNNAARK